MFDHNRVLLFDFETTGLNGFTEEIIEIGAVLLEKQNGQHEIVQELSLLVIPSRPLPSKIVEITHITDEMLLREGVSQDEAFHRFFDLYQDENTLLIAYNIQFDLLFLQTLFRRHWNKFFTIKNDILDVMAIYRDRHRYPHKLDACVQTYHVDVKNTHRALDDIKATYAALQQMAIERNNIKHYVNKVGYNGNYGVSGIRLPHVKYVPQKGGFLEIEKG
ncbi:MAG: 3'-5' exonuclease [Acholeplasmataceae bacterium]|jgi:DNA polymerase III epsilon subunit family exonuclease|nr:3'-5' exonuclease [Acholeplasmataceae bacterium]